MKKQNSWKNILPTLMVVGVIITVSIACQLFGDSKYQGGDKTPGSTPMSNANTSKNDKSPTPSPSSTASPTNNAVNNSNNSTSTKGNSYQDNLPAGFRVPNDSVGKRIMSDYGALYVAKGGVTLPPTAIFENADECAKWQATLKTSKASIGGLSTELQEPAMKSHELRPLPPELAPGMAVQFLSRQVSPGHAASSPTGKVLSVTGWFPSTRRGP